MVTDDGVFVTDAGARISVRVLAAAPPATALLEPLYATDLDLLDGVTGELRAPGGMTWRGLVQRQGRAFALYPEPPESEESQRRTHAGPSETVPDPVLDEFKEPARTADPSQAEAIEAAETLSGFVGGDPGIAANEAKQALSLISRFIANSERKLEGS